MPISFHISHVVADTPADSVDIADDIRYSYVAGTLAPGEFLPLASIVAKQLAVDESQVLSAYSELVDAGLLVRDGDRVRAVADSNAPAAEQNVRYVLERRLRIAIQAAARAGYEPARIQTLLNEALDAEFQDAP